MNSARNIYRGLATLLSYKDDMEVNFAPSMVFVYFGQPFEDDSEYEWMIEHGWKACGKDWYYQTKGEDKSE